EPLVVPGRAREIGVTGNLQPHRPTRSVLLRCDLDDLLTLRGDVLLIPIEEDQIHLRRWRRWRRRRQRRRRRWWGAKLHRHAGEEVVRMIAGGVLAAAATVGPP